MALAAILGGLSASGSPTRVVDVDGASGNYATGPRFSGCFSEAPHRSQLCWKIKEAQTERMTMFIWERVLAEVRCGEYIPEISVTRADVGGERLAPRVG
jgi:hypothetical protein